MNEPKQPVQDDNPRWIIDGPGREKFAAELRAKGLNVFAGDIKACEVCGFFECVCGVRKLHTENCRFRKVAECYFSFACDEHDLDICPECDACTCGGHDVDAE